MCMYVDTVGSLGCRLREIVVGTLVDVLVDLVIGALVSGLGGTVAGALMSAVVCVRVGLVVSALGRPVVSALSYALCLLLYLLYLPFEIDLVIVDEFLTIYAHGYGYALGYGRLGCTCKCTRSGTWKCVLGVLASGLGAVVVSALFRVLFFHSSDEKLM